MGPPTGLPVTLPGSPQPCTLDLSGSQDSGSVGRGPCLLLTSRAAGGQEPSLQGLPTLRLPGAGCPRHACPPAPTPQLTLVHQSGPLLSCSRLQPHKTPPLAQPGRSRCPALPDGKAPGSCAPRPARTFPGQPSASLTSCPGPVRSRWKLCTSRPGCAHRGWRVRRQLPGAPQAVWGPRRRNPVWEGRPPCDPHELPSPSPLYPGSCPSLPPSLVLNPDFFVDLYNG